MFSFCWSVDWCLLNVLYNRILFIESPKSIVESVQCSNRSLLRSTKACAELLSHFGISASCLDSELTTRNWTSMNGLLLHALDTIRENGIDKSD